ncbi:MAG: hypothetical protein V3S29_12145, partial [bacterium]
VAGVGKGRAGPVGGMLHRVHLRVAADAEGGSVLCDQRRVVGAPVAAEILLRNLRKPAHEIGHLEHKKKNRRSFKKKLPMALGRQQAGSMPKPISPKCHSEQSEESVVSNKGPAIPTADSSLRSE